ncbi:BTAD domain-containing putative transcriptional regulator [Nonomuraea sp. NPDC049646]|uniref:BTAD domain-containing putative transcriptional regulator n=1 Tax=unclassified Nonomuraea TaxID=2593643 RepID=UPI003796A4DF
MAANIRVAVLGPVELVAGHRRTGLPRSRLRAVLGLLAFTPGRVVSVERLVDGLYGEQPPAEAVRTLHTYISHLRRRLREAGLPGVLETRAPGYRLALVPGEVDAAVFESEVLLGRGLLAEEVSDRAAGVLAGALELWRGDVLADCQVHGWAHGEMERLREMRLSATEDVLTARLRLGLHRAAAEQLEHLVVEHPLREHLWELLMIAHALSGRQGDALATFQRARRVLDDELGVEPGPALRAIEANVLRRRLAAEDLLPPGGAPVVRQVTAAPAVPAGGRTGVPAPITRLVGRAADLAELRPLVEGHRLVTLTGMGGVGKTRLAMAVALSMEATLDAAVDAGFDGVHFVELARVEDPELVAPAIADLLGVHAAGGHSTLRALAEHLGTRRVLLVLDNCEHLADACAAVAHELLTSCPSVHILATSRETLRVGGELVWRVPPLGAPPSAELFLERAGLGPAARLDDDQRAALSLICADLDGLPLALELAAARARVLTLPQIAERLHDHFTLLTGGPRTSPPQHRTMRAVIDWSHALLDAGERELLGALSVFPGGCDLSAAAAVSAEPDVLDLLGRLVDKSLLTVEPTPAGARYRMSQTIRQFAAGELTPQRRDLIARRHAEHYLAFAEKAEGELRGPGLGAALDRIAAEHDNLRAACTYGAADEVALRIAGAVWRYCHLRGHYSEGRHWLETALRHAGAAPEPYVAKALGGAATLTAYECDYAPATGYAERALAACRRLGDAAGVARALSMLGEIARETGDFDRALRTHEQARQEYRTAGDAWGEAFQVELLALASWLAGRFTEARAWAREAHDEFVRLGDKERIGWTLLDLAACDLYDGDPAHARDLLLEALALFEDVGFPEGLGWADNLLALADLADLTGAGSSGADLGAAARRLGRALDVQHRLGDLCRSSSVVEAIARTLHLDGSHAAAAELLGGAAAIRETISAPVPPCETADLAALETGLRTALGADAYQARHTTGRRRTIARTVATALSATEEAAT